MSPRAAVIHDMDVEDMDLDSSSSIDSDELEQQVQRPCGRRPVTFCTVFALLALACWLGFATLRNGGHSSVSSHLKESEIENQWTGWRQEDLIHTSPFLAAHAHSPASKEVSPADTTTPLLEGSTVLRPSLTDLSEDLHDPRRRFQHAARPGARCCNSDG